MKAILPIKNYGQCKSFCGQTNGQTDKQKDRQTDGWINRRAKNYMPLEVSMRGHKNS